MARCFAMAKDSEYTYPEDRNKPENIPTCYVLDKENFALMRRNLMCGSPKTCPFFKTKRNEVRA